MINMGMFYFFFAIRVYDSYGFDEFESRYRMALTKEYSQGREYRKKEKILWERREKKYLKNKKLQ